MAQPSDQWMALLPDQNAVCRGMKMAAPELAPWTGWFHNGSDLEPTVTVNLSIKGVPEDLAERLRARAAAHHRSLQGELMAILEEAVAGDRFLSVREVLTQVRGLGVQTGDEATDDVRSDRDGR